MTFRAGSSSLAPSTAALTEGSRFKAVPDPRGQPDEAVLLAAALPSLLAGFKRCTDLLVRPDDVMDETSMRPLSPVSLKVDACSDAASDAMFCGF